MMWSLAMTGDAYRLTGECLFDLGYLPLLPATNAPRYLYGKGDHCAHVVEVPIRESRLWCPVCKLTDQSPSMLKRIFVAPAMQQVWHEHFNWTTGQLESDRKRMEEHLHAHSSQISEDLGIGHTFERTDPSELRKMAKTNKNGNTVETGLPATHDRAVQEGRKPSRGKFVW
jgi:hypothetical protein